MIRSPPRSTLLTHSFPTRRSSDLHHHNDHEHDHGLRGIVRHVFVPHTHDAADSVDDALEASTQGIRALKVSLVVLLATTVLQGLRSEEHTSELQSLMRSSYAVFCLKKKKHTLMDNSCHHLD